MATIFEKPQAMSACAARDLAVRELHGHAFLDCYQKMMEARLGNAAWLLPLGKALRAKRWAGQIISRPLLCGLCKLCFVLGHLINQYCLAGLHFAKN